MSFTNFQKTIALTSGVLVLSVAIGYVVLAWSGPGANPPAGNAPAPINVGSDAQTKAGNLTVSALTTSGGKLYLNNSGFEGDIERVDEIIGHNDLQLRDSVNKTKINLDVGNTGKIEFYTNNQERMRIEEDGDLHKQGDLYIENGNLNIEELTNVPDFEGCFLQIDEFGKVKCYTGGGIPGGNLLETAQFLVASDSRSQPCDSYSVIIGDVEKVVKVYGYLNVSSSGSFEWARFRFYINGAEVWGKLQNGAGSWSDTRYYHVTEGDTLQVCASDGGVAGHSSLAQIYTVNARREFITHAFSDGNILYWYGQAARGEMSVPTLPGHYIAPDILNPASVIISAKDEIDVKWIID